MPVTLTDEQAKNFTTSRKNIATALKGIWML
jgi:hypothetical protein